MKTIYNAAHSLHRSEHEFFRGEKVPAFEKPERADWVLAAVQREKLGEIIAPAAHGEGGFGDKVQKPRGPVPSGVRMRHVDDRVRCAQLLDDLPG